MNLPSREGRFFLRAAIVAAGRLRAGSLPRTAVDGERGQHPPSFPGMPTARTSDIRAVGADFFRTQRGDSPDGR
jgi:hypothetical protein